MDVVQRITELLEPFCEREGYRIYKIVLSGGAYKKRVAVFVDGVDRRIMVEDLTKVNRFLGDILDAEDIIQSRYWLEVSSPGMVDLKEDRDYEFFRGSFCRVVCTKETFTGILESHDEQSIVLRHGDDVIEIPRADILKARLDVEL